MSFVRTLKTILVTIPVQCTTTYPTIFLASLTLPYKLLVFTLSKLLRPDLISFVHGMSAWFSVDSIHTQPANNLTYFVVLDGTITLQRFKQLFKLRVLDKDKDKNNANSINQALYEIPTQTLEEARRVLVKSAPAPRPRLRSLKREESIISATYDPANGDNEGSDLHRKVLLKTASLDQIKLGTNSATMDFQKRNSMPTTFDIQRRNSIISTTPSTPSSKSSTTNIQENDNENIKKENLIYGKLRQYWTNFLGYNFWKWDETFDLNNHIHIFDDKESRRSSIFPSGKDASSFQNMNNSAKFRNNAKIYDKSDLPTIKRNLLAKPFQEKRSPWEILLLYNYYDNCEVLNEKPESESEGEKMIVILRIHHALADGYSLLKALQHDLPGRITPLSIAQPNYGKKSMCNQVLNVLTCPLEVAKIYVDSIDRENKWNLVFPFGQSPSGRFYTSLTNPIKVQMVKEIKSKFGVSYLGVMMTAVCGGIRRTMIDAGQTVPNYVSFVCPLPRWKHPGGLVNHMKTTTIVLPMGRMSTVDRLKMIEEQIRYEKTTMVRYVLTTYYEIWGFLPTALIRANQKCHLIPSFLVSNFPVPEQTTVIDGCPVSEFYVGYGYGFMNWGATIMMFGDGGKQSVVVSMDQVSYPSQDKFENLGGYIEEELNILANSFPV